MMATFARMQNNIAVDVFVEHGGFTISQCFNPEVVAHFTIVPDGTTLGSTLNADGTWTIAAIVAPPAPVVKTTTTISVIEFFDRFTPQEEAGIRASSDAVVKILLLRLDDPRVLNVDLSLPTISMGLGYLATMTTPLLTASRVAQILAPQAIA